MKSVYTFLIALHILIIPVQAQVFVAHELITVKTHTRVMKSLFMSNPDCIKQRVSRNFPGKVEIQLAKSGCLNPQDSAILLRASQNARPVDSSLAYSKFIGETEKAFYKPKSHEAIEGQFLLLGRKYPQYVQHLNFSKALFTDGKSTIYNPHWYGNTPMYRKKIDWGDVAWADLKGAFWGGPEGAIIASISNLVIQLLE